MSKKRSYEASSKGDLAAEETSAQVFISSSIKDRASMFMGAYSPSIPEKALQARDDFKTASHRIVAWRKPSNQKSLGFSNSKPDSKTIYTTGSDDDGEKWAGKKLEKVLIELNVEGAVVVARWYGGVLLGPVRFKHIEDVAKEAISKWQANETPQDSSKKQRTETEPSVDPAEAAMQKEALVRQLLERDNSIVVLRELLAEKQAKKTGEADSNSIQESKLPSASPVAKPSYSYMPIKTLQQLDKARDATIAWILKQIDAAETDPGLPNG